MQAIKSKGLHMHAASNRRNQLTSVAITSRLGAKKVSLFLSKVQREFDIKMTKLVKQLNCIVLTYILVLGESTPLVGCWLVN